MAVVPVVVVREKTTGLRRVINLSELDWNGQRPLVPDVRECVKPRLTRVQRLMKEVHAAHRP